MCAESSSAPKASSGDAIASATTASPDQNATRRPRGKSRRRGAERAASSPAGRRAPPRGGAARAPAAPTTTRARPRRPGTWPDAIGPAGGRCDASRAAGSFGRMERLEERDERRRLRRREVRAVRRHVASALQDLAEELVLRQPRRDVVERRAAPAPGVAERVAVAALLVLEDERALAHDGAPALEVLRGHRQGAPRVHDRRPRRRAAVVRQRRPAENGEDDDEDRDRAPAPALLPHARPERQQEQDEDRERRPDEQRERLERSAA